MNSAHCRLLYLASLEVPRLQSEILFRHYTRRQTPKSNLIKAMDSLEKKHLDTSRGFRYRYYISSASQADNSKPALLLCHGFPDGADLYQFIVPHLLRSRMRIVVPDLLGYGGTSKPTDPQSYEIRGMVNDVMEIIKAEKIEQEIMPLGHDWYVSLSIIANFHSDRLIAEQGFISRSTLLPPQYQPLRWSHNSLRSTDGPVRCTLQPRRS